MTTRAFQYPPTDEIGTVDDDGKVRINQTWANYLRGLEDASGRVAANLAAGSTTDQLLAAMKTAGQMKADT